MRKKLSFIFKALSLTLISFAAGCKSTNLGNKTLALDLGSWGSSADLWLLNQQRDSGEFESLVDPSRGIVLQMQNQQGQLVMARRLATLAKQRPLLKANYDRQLEWLFERLVKTSEGGQLFFNGKETNLGEQALVLSALVASPLGTTTSDRLDSLAATIMDHWSKELGFAEHIRPSKTNSEFLQRLYTAQAALALIEYYEKSQTDRAILIATEALEWLDRNYPKKDEASFHPTQATWHIAAINALNRVSPEPQLDEKILSMTDQLLALQDRRLIPGSFSGHPTKFGSPNIVRDAQATRTLLLGLEIASRLDDRKRLKRYRVAARLGLANLRAHQFEVGNVETFSKPGNAVGAVRYKYTLPLIRLDGVVFSAMAFEHASRLAWNGIL